MLGVQRVEEDRGPHCCSFCPLKLLTSLCWDLTGDRDACHLITLSFSFHLCSFIHHSFCSILFYSILFYSILFYSILFYSILLFSVLYITNLPFPPLLFSVILIIFNFVPLVLILPYPHNLFLLFSPILTPP